MNKEILNNNSCTKDWEKMSIIENGRFCSGCNKNLLDLTDEKLEVIATKHYGRNKCIALTNEQIEFFVYYKKIKRLALVSSLFFGTVFLNLTYGQSNEKHKDSCLIKGKLINKNKEIITNRSIYIYIKDSDIVYETKTNQNGEFKINLPKNCEIDYSNIDKLISKKTRNKKSINLRKVKLKQPIRRSPGFF